MSNSEIKLTKLENIFGISSVKLNDQIISIENPLLLNQKINIIYSPNGVWKSSFTKFIKKLSLENFQIPDLANHFFPDRISKFEINFDKYNINSESFKPYKNIISITNNENIAIKDDNGEKDGWKKILVPLESESFNLIQKLKKDRNNIVSNVLIEINKMNLIDKDDKIKNPLFCLLEFDYINKDNILLFLENINESITKFIDYDKSIFENDSIIKINEYLYKNQKNITKIQTVINHDYFKQLHNEYINLTSKWNIYYLTPAINKWKSKNDKDDFFKYFKIKTIDQTIDNSRKEKEIESIDDLNKIENEIKRQYEIDISEPSENLNKLKQFYDKNPDQRNFIIFFNDLIKNNSDDIGKIFDYIKNILVSKVIYSKILKHENIEENIETWLSEITKIDNQIKINKKKLKKEYKNTKFQEIINKVLKNSNIPLEMEVYEAYLWTDEIPTLRYKWLDKWLENDIQSYKNILSSGENKTLNILMLIVKIEIKLSQMKSSKLTGHLWIVLDDVIESYDNNNKNIFFRVLRNLIRNNKNLSFVILTHDFNISRSIVFAFNQKEISLHMSYKKIKNNNENEINVVSMNDENGIIKNEYKSIFDNINNNINRIYKQLSNPKQPPKSELSDIQIINFLIILIPIYRNINKFIESEGTKDNNNFKADVFCHYYDNKNSMIDITFNNENIQKIYKTIFKIKDKPETELKDNTNTQIVPEQYLYKNIIDTLYSSCHKIANKGIKNISSEDYFTNILLLSFGIRITSEEIFYNFYKNLGKIKKYNNSLNAMIRQYKNNNDTKSDTINKLIILIDHIAYIINDNIHGHSFQMDHLISIDLNDLIHLWNGINTIKINDK